MQISKIRVIVPSSPGFGHQSAAAITIDRLRQLGYAGVIQILYINEVKYKLRYLFPIFNPEGPSFQSYEQESIEFLDFLDFHKNKEKYGEVDLGIIAGTDTYYDPDFLGVRMLLTLQPMNWGDQSRSHSIQFNAEFGQGVFFLDELKKLGFYKEISISPNNLTLPNVTISSPFEGRSKVIRESLNLILSSENIDFVAAYGHYMRYGQSINYAAGLINAYESNPQLFPNGMIVVVFNYLSDLDKSEMAKQLNDLPDIKERVSMLAIEDDGLQESLSKLERGKVLILNVGPVERPIFEHFFINSKLPPVVEGRNSMNLMQMIGKSFLPSCRKESFQCDHVPEVALLAVNEITDEVPRANLLQTSLNIGQFIVQSRTPGSPTELHFSSIKVQPKHDKLLLGLIKLEEVLKSKKESDTLPTPSLGALKKMVGRCNSLLSTYLNE